MADAGSLANIFDAATAVIREIPRSGILIVTLIALAAGVAGSTMRRFDVPLGGLIRMASTVTLIGVLITVTLQLARFDSRMDVVVPDIGLPRQVVEGGETRVPMAPDGHFWLRAEVNGKSVDFMVDTGATLTAVSSGAADKIGLKARRGGIPVRITTANGIISAGIATADEIRFGNVAARGLDVVIAPQLGETNVIGMNLLSRLKGWRVEGNVLILTPNNPQAAVESSGA